MLLYFIRHGRPEYPQDQFGNLLIYGPKAGLSHEGKNRIAAIARSIMKREGRGFDRLISSPYERAIQTARLVAEVMEMEPAKITEDARLRDTDSTWPGQPVDRFLEVWNERKVFDDPNMTETLDDLRDRMTAAVQEHTQESEGQMIGFVVHGDPLRAWVYPHDRAFRSYREVVEATFDAAEGVRVVTDEAGETTLEILSYFQP